MKIWKQISTILWCLTWPISEVIGRPQDVEENVTWQKGLKLIGIAIVLGLVATLIVISVVRSKWWV